MRPIISYPISELIFLKQYRLKTARLKVLRLNINTITNFKKYKDKIILKTRCKHLMNFSQLAADKRPE